MRRFERCVGLLLASFLLALPGAAEPARRSARPIRIVLITLDTLRLDAFLAPGEASTMPATRRFAARGLVFTHCFASSSTTQPTHASLFTALQPWEHGVTRNGVVLGEQATTLAEHLEAQGFRTHAIVASFPLHAQFGFAQGFERYGDDFDVRYVQSWEGRVPEGGGFFSRADGVTQQALAALDAAQGERQFFWFHYFDPHDPYGDSAASEGGTAGVTLIDQLYRAARARDPEIEALLRAAREAYARDVRSLDRALARLFERLDADAGRFATHVLITADHGESFGEGLALGHNQRLTREQVQVPLVLVSPSVAPGTRHDLASSVDVARTLLAAAGLDAGPFGGRNLLAERDALQVLGMRRTGVKRPETLLDGRLRRLPQTWFFSVRDGVLWSGNTQGVLEEDDPRRVARGERAEELRATFGALERLLEARGTGDEILDPEVQERLRALGYAP